MVESSDGSAPSPLGERNRTDSAAPALSNPVSLAGAPAKGGLSLKLRNRVLPFCSPLPQVSKVGIDLAAVELLTSLGSLEKLSAHLETTCRMLRGAASTYGIAGLGIAAAQQLRCDRERGYPVDQTAMNVAAAFYVLTEGMCDVRGEIQGCDGGGGRGSASLPSRKRVGSCGAGQWHASRDIRQRLSMTN